MTKRLSDKEKARRQKVRANERWLKYRCEGIEADAEALQSVLHSWTLNFRPLHPDVRRLQKRIKREIIPPHIMRYKRTILKLHKALSEARRAIRSAEYRARDNAERVRWLKDHPGRKLRDLDRLIKHPGHRAGEGALNRYQVARDAWTRWEANRTPMPAELFKETA